MQISSRYRCVDHGVCRSRGEISTPGAQITEAVIAAIGGQVRFVQLSNRDRLDLRNNHSIYRLLLTARRFVLDFLAPLNTTSLSVRNQAYARLILRVHYHRPTDHSIERLDSFTRVRFARTDQDTRISGYGTGITGAGPAPRRKQAGGTYGQSA